MTEILPQSGDIRFPNEKEILDTVSQFQSDELSELIIQIEMSELIKLMVFGMIVVFLFTMIFGSSIGSFVLSLFSKLKKYIPKIVWIRK